MVLMLNGSFGVGKTTVANLLRLKLADSRVFDPEWIGYVLRRLPTWVPASTKALSDYQDAAHWRIWTARAIVLTQRLDRHVIVPMTFSNPEYLAEIRDRILRRGVLVRHYCLTASESCIRERLKRRGLQDGSPEANWVLPRVSRCCSAHMRPEFAEQVPTDDLKAEDVAAEIARRFAVA